MIFLFSDMLAHYLLLYLILKIANMALFHRHILTTIDLLPA